MPSADQLLLKQLKALFDGSSLTPEELQQAQQRLLEQTQAWAAGFWKVESDSLLQLLFAKDPAFDEQVARDFQLATQRVSLEQTQLGIVNAVVHQRPALAVSTEQSGDLRKSASWLEKFGARCSWSMPLKGPSGNVVAVLAVSWKDLCTEQSEETQRVINLAKQLEKEI